MPEARRLGDLIREFSMQDGVSERLKAYKVVAEWEEIVGGMIGKNTELVRVENGILYVRAANPAWRNELVFMKPSILRKIREKYPESGVTDIFFI